MAFKSGFVSIVGRPNAGKSTLLNQILNHKISIVTNKAQTTRNKIEGIYNDDDAQIIFIDTPGVHKPINKLDEQLNKMAFSTLKDSEINLFIVDASKSIGVGDDFLLNEVKKSKQKLILILNKIDLISKSELIEISDKWSKLHNFDEIIPLSSLNGDNVQTLIKVIKKYLPEGPLYYSKEDYCTYPEKFIISELIREKIIILTEEEIPHSVAVIVEQMKQKKTKTFHIHASIIVDKDSKKAIIIGKGGQMIKNIGIMARKDIEELLGIKIMLELFVRVEKDWRNDLKYLKEFGYKDN